MNNIDIAKRVLEQEIKGLDELKDSIAQNFSDVVEKIHQCKGRVILAGMGKSGHIARKIAATLASTGTPAFFVHPGEASHGDLGMITEEDIVIIFSNSGVTAEIMDMVAYCLRFKIFMVGVARKKNSDLIEKADIGIVIPETEEANEVNAPTTSTTQMLAWGDALAVCLLKKKGFESEHFKNYHPGGKLGAAFVTVHELSHKGDEIPLINEDEKMPEALLKITGKKFGCAGVLNKAGNLIGIITDGDLRRHISNLMECKTSEVMTPNPITIRPKALAAEALNIMNTKRITSLFITENQKPVGIIHIHDLLRAGVS